MLAVADLSCSRGYREIFSGLSFTLVPGEWLHVTGDNGAGKTSLLRILSGLALPESGELRWDGALVKEAADAYRADVAYLGHSLPLKDELSAAENLIAASALRGVALATGECRGLLERVGLAARWKLPVRFLSQGQKRRVALASLLAREARLWILDEPFVALDQWAASWLEQTVAEHLAAGGMAVLTSHQPLQMAGRPGRTLRLGA